MISRLLFVRSANGRRTEEGEKEGRKEGRKETCYNFSLHQSAAAQSSKSVRPSVFVRTKDFEVRESRSFVSKTERGIQGCSIMYDKRLQIHNQFCRSTVKSVHGLGLEKCQVGLVKLSFDI